MKKGGEVPLPPVVDGDPKTFIMYGNIDEPEYTDNIMALGRAVASGALVEGQRIVVYHEEWEGNAVFELVRDGSRQPGFRADTLKRYKRGEVKTLDPDDMRRIITDMRGFAPANHYGLAFGAHGNGWLLKNSGVSRLAGYKELWERPKNPLTRSRFFQGGGQNMDVSEFVEAVGDMEWDFLLLDVCLMSSIEALWDMRGVADYIIASPTETLLEGFPYERVANILFDDWNDLAGVARAYVDHYRNLSDPYATVAIIRTSELQGLAQAVRDIRLDGCNDVDPYASNIQYYEGRTNHVFWDLDHYMRHWAQNPVLYGAFLDQLEKTVVFSDHTDYFVSAWGSGLFKIDHYSGISAFIPTARTEKLMPDYRNTGWYRAVFAD